MSELRKMLEKMSMAELGNLEAELRVEMQRKRAQTIKDLREKCHQMARESGLTMFSSAKVATNAAKLAKDEPRQVLFDPVSKTKYAGRGRPPIGFNFTRARATG